MLLKFLKKHFIIKITSMSEIRHDWVKTQVGEYIDKSVDNEDGWIIKALAEIQKKGKITNAQDVFVIQNALKGL